MFENMDSSHNPFVLCCAGIELFGNVILTDNYCNYARKKEQFFLLNGLQNRQFKYANDFDKNGILYWIGTQFGTVNFILLFNFIILNNIVFVCFLFVNNNSLILLEYNLSF